MNRPSAAQGSAWRHLRHAPSRTLASLAVAVAIALAAMGVWSNNPAAAQAPNTLPALTQPVTDLAGVIDPASADAIDRLSRSLQSATGDVVVVVTVPTVDPYADIREYAVKLFENHGRGIGTRGQDNGLLILLAVRERRVWVEVGYGLESWITDGFAGQTSRDDMVPSFRSGQYGQGLLNGTARIVNRIAQGRNVTLTGVPQPAPRQRVAQPLGIPLWVVVLVFIAIILLSRSAGGPGGGSHVRRWGRRGGWSSGVGPFGGGFGGGYSGGGWGGSGGFGGGFGGFGGGRSGGGGGGAGW